MPPTTAIICWLEGSRSKSSDWGLVPIAWTTTYTHSLALDRLASVPYNMGQQTADHMLQTCPTYAASRDIWPSPTSLEKKLYGSLGDLRATVAFIRGTGLDIWTGTNDKEEEGHCLVTLPCVINETIKWLPNLMRKAFWWWQCSG